MRSKRFWSWRFPLAAALAALALVVDAIIFLPRPVGTRVLMARVPICAGCEINPRDLREHRSDPGALPQHCFVQAGEAAGKKAAVALEPGTVVTPGLLLKNSLADLVPGEATFVLSVEDPAVAGLSETGQIAEIWSFSPSVDNQLLVTNVRVLGMEAAKDNLLGVTSPKAIVYPGASEEATRKVVAAKSPHDLSFAL